jgi:hypothetical protein
VKRQVAHHKPLVDLNNLLKYKANTNGAKKGKGTMLTHSLGLEQFGHGVNEKPA